ncbi:hypothetical protein [Sphingobium sp. Cam5-1]|uniref:hypothetical protein n=1 Tax=Sphingobium sp. Cam5-1 TaxID=2789327 RepID=UPI0018AD14A8|nr:hypothetical protein [Sphingobium sp. Cam5-1]QPI74775.1 hypothetical protein IZV00_18135 [Sphingobium sp. Cam5-1]
MANSPDIAALIPAEALQEIGRLIINWSQVESVFDLIFLRIVVMEGKESMTMDDPKFKEMAHGIKRRCKRLRLHFKTSKLSDEEKLPWIKALDTLSSLNRWRDLLAHGVINPLKDGDSAAAVHIYFKSWNSPTKHDFGPVKISAIKQNREKIALLWHELIRLSLEGQTGV